MQSGLLPQVSAEGLVLCLFLALRLRAFGAMLTNKPKNKHKNKPEARRDRMVYVPYVLYLCANNILTGGQDVVGKIIITTDTRLPRIFVSLDKSDTKQAKLDFSLFLRHSSSTTTFLRFSPCLNFLLS